MEYTKREIEILHDCDDDNGDPTVWSMKVCDGHWIFIEKYGEKEYAVTDDFGYILADGKIYKTLAGAKRSAEGIAYRLENSYLDD